MPKSEDPAKLGVSIRLTPLALQIAAEVQDREGSSRSQAIESIIRDYGRRHGIPVKPEGAGQ